MNTDQYPKLYLYRRIVQAKLYIDKYYSEKIDLGNISDEAHFSKFHFIRLFKEVYGKTPHQYLSNVRIEKAQLMLQKNIPVTEVCFAVGFESISSFSGLFKKITKTSPAQFLKNHKQLQAQKKEKPLSFVPGCYAYMHGWNENSNFEEGREK